VQWLCAAAQEGGRPGQLRQALHAQQQQQQQQQLMRSLVLLVPLMVVVVVHKMACCLAAVQLAWHAPLLQAAAAPAAAAACVAQCAAEAAAVPVHAAAAAAEYQHLSLQCLYALLVWSVLLLLLLLLLVSAGWAAACEYVPSACAEGTSRYGLTPAKHDNSIAACRVALNRDLAQQGRAPMPCTMHAALVLLLPYVLLVHSCTTQHMKAAKKNSCITQPTSTPALHAPGNASRRNH
jgi:hypothetical protein